MRSALDCSCFGRGRGSRAVCLRFLWRLMYVLAQQAGGFGDAYMAEMHGSTACAVGVQRSITHVAGALRSGDASCSAEKRAYVLGAAARVAR